MALSLSLEEKEVARPQDRSFGHEQGHPRQRFFKLNGRPRPPWEMKGGFAKCKRWWCLYGENVQICVQNFREQIM
jgi:hypothetical protein